MSAPRRPAPVAAQRYSQAPAPAPVVAPRLALAARPGQVNTGVQLQNAAHVPWYRRAAAAVNPFGEAVHKNPAKHALMEALALIAAQNPMTYSHAMDLLNAARNYLARPNVAPDNRNYAYKFIVETYLEPVKLMKERATMTEVQASEAHPDYPVRRIVVCALKFLKNSQKALREFGMASRHGHKSSMFGADEMTVMTRSLSASNQVVFDFFVERITSLRFEYDPDEAAPGEATTGELVAILLKQLGATMNSPKPGYERSESGRFNPLADPEPEEVVVEEAPPVESEENALYSRLNAHQRTGAAVWGSAPPPSAPSGYRPGKGPLRPAGGLSDPSGAASSSSRQGGRKSRKGRRSTKRRSTRRN